MTKRTFALVGCLLLGACAVQQPTDSAPSTQPRPDRGHFNVDGHVGYRSVQGSGWKGSSDQGVLGASVDYTPPGFPIGVEGALFGSSRWHENPGPDTIDTIGDMSVGLRTTVGLGRNVRAYIGGGAAGVWAEHEVWVDYDSRRSDDDSSFAWYGHAGLYVRLNDRFNLGIDGRTTQNSELKIFGDEADADHWQVTVFFGWGW